MLELNGVEFDASVLDILYLLKAQLNEQGIELLKSIKDVGDNVMISCPYHKNGQERRPSAGVKKEDGTFHCFHGDTKVITRELGAIDIYSICDKPIHILNGNGEWETVIFHNYGKQPLMKLTLSCNTKKKIIYATPEHEWLIHNYNRKYQTQELKPNMYLDKCVPKNICNVTLDPQGIIHGFCYGDGNTYGHNISHKTYYNRCYFYNEPDLELKQYFSDAEFKEGIAGNGKLYEYALFKSNRNLKNVPSMSESDSYLLGFLAGYFVADGNCFNNKLTIYSHKYDDLYRVQQICTKLGIMSTEIGTSNISKGKRGCIDVKVDTNGYTLRLVRNTIPDNFFITSKGRDSVQKYTGRSRYKVVSVEQTDLVEDVYCCQTSTHSFALEHFILTGNCFACEEVHSLPELISNCLGENDGGALGYKWLLQNYISVAKEERRDVELDCDRNESIAGFSTSTGVSRHPDYSNNHISQDLSNNFVKEEELDKYRVIHPYWAKRKITDKNIIELFDLGYDKETDCITFPVRDANGNCLFVARRSVKTKFFNYSKDVEKPLYGLYELAISTRIPRGSTRTMFYSEIIICESMIDALTCWQYGKPALALNGLGNELQFLQLNALPVRKYILATDNDEAGMKARKRIRKNLPYKIVTEYILPEGKKDINELTKEEFDALEEEM